MNKRVVRIRKPGRGCNDLRSSISETTRRQQMAEAMAQTAREKDLILSSIEESVILHDLDMKIIYANEMASITESTPAQEMVGRHCYEVRRNHPNPCPDDCPVRMTLETGHKGSKQMSTADGMTWQVKSFPVKNSKNELIGAVEITKDITDRKKMEHKMARLDRMNLIGEMAASFGHEIRNPMATVKGFLQMLSGKDELRQFIHYFEIMIEEIDRANSIITEYLTLSKDKVVVLSLQNLNSIVDGLYPLILADALHADMSVELNLTDIPLLLLDKNEVHQLLLNLVRNGLEAMRPGGVLGIRTYRERDEVILAVKDQGQGIDPAIIPKLGIPFVTTKENGTGIGLAICYKIAERNNGHIDVETDDSGTSFYVKFKIPAATN